MKNRFALILLLCFGSPLHAWPMKGANETIKSPSNEREQRSAEQRRGEQVSDGSLLDDSNLIRNRMGLQGHPLNVQTKSKRVRPKVETITVSEW